MNISINWVIILIFCSVYYPPKALADQYHQLADEYWAQAEELSEQEAYLEAAQLYEKSLEAEQSSAHPRLEDLAAELNMAAYCYDEIGQYDKALTYYKQVLEIDRELGNEAEIAIDLNNIGGVYHEWGQYDKALAYHEQALELARKTGDQLIIPTYLTNIGVVYDVWGQYDNAIAYYEQALAIDRELGNETEVSADLRNIAGVYYAWGQYDKANAYYEQALELARKTGQKSEIATIFKRIGMVYNAWGQYDTAMTYYQQALELDRKLGREADIALHLTSIGAVYDEWGQYDKALAYHEQALELARKLGIKSGITSYLNNIGAVYEKREQYDNALNYYEQALEIARKLGEESSISIYLNNIGELYRQWGQDDKALAYFQQALELARKLGEKSRVATRLNNIGVVYYYQEKYTDAIPYFADAVAILEKIRKTATGDARRDYFASQIDTYRFLISCYIRIGDFENAFNIIELSRAKRLEEQLRGSDIAVRIPSLEHLQQTLPEDTVVLIYANTVEQHIAHMFMTKNTFSASEHSFSELALNNMLPDSAHIIKQYRAQLFNPSFSRGLNIPERDVAKQQDEAQDAAPPNLSRHLYSFLIGDIREQLQGKTTLLILPDGILNFLPFETLVDKQGRYLAETYRITYAQSLGVLELIGQRRYTSGRKSLLAFGGAVYEEQTYQEEMAESETQLVYVRKQIDLALKRRSSLQKIYTQLGRGSWENLPGTLAEVKAIQEVVTDAVILTGSDVNEMAVKTLSTNGELNDYKVLHFATHGDINPQMPDLSALVLSLTPTLSGREDGYLRAAEIAEIDIETDFVNLSACETGLGKLYGGEGVVGLTQAFLLAGANGVSVSLWPVADESTAQFMVMLYSLVENEDLTYPEAMSEVKRRFIAGDFGEAWKAPYFWAPFVYYGK